ncbi:MAG: calcium-translocating P-type ATPase, PMCA-type [Candidatus Micrarchaeota archaeon]|nr:calcium-translocating P-type ATPase, PMCA-type [Candidatus Micrarchaeota archaeon]
MVQGLSSSEAARRLRIYGKNEIEEGEGVSPFRLFISQFTSPVTLILIAAAFLSGLMSFYDRSSITDAILILLIVVFSGVLGFVQEYRAERTVEVLKSMAAPKARVIRDGKEVVVSALEIVPGDVVVLAAGDVVPADGKVIESRGLKIDESPLTGESRPVRKKKGDRVFMHTSVLVGEGLFLVERTGMKTEMGRIAGKLKEMRRDRSAFQEEMEHFGKAVCRTILVLAAIMVVIGMLKYDIFLSVLTAVSLAVAAIPEGLPAVVALSLALGARVMASRNALVRRLSVVETIGSVDVICTDKTGTITRGEMSVREVYPRESEIMIECCGVANDAEVVSSNGKRIYTGDETDIALRKFAEERGFTNRFEKVKEYPFSSKRKMMSVVVLKNGTKYTFSKGAPEVILERCAAILDNNRVKKLTRGTRERIMKKVEEMASRSLRVIALAYRKGDGERDLIFIGLLGLEDPPRKGVKEAIRTCRTAGIRVIMLTGDNPVTAKAIASEIGLETSGVVTGKDMDSMDNSELERVLESGVNVFARISPFHKLRILEVLKKKSRVAMTGDGVNDALALKKADVGVSMGIRGTEVAREASDMILLDDDFSTIPKAVKEGRRIFENIRKFVNYLFVSNFAEVAVIFLLTVVVTLNEPVLLPVQILWINLLTDGLPALALGVDPAPRDIMKRPPRPKGEPIINRRLAWLIGVIGTKKTLALLFVFFFFLPSGFETARTALFTGFILFEFVRIGSIRATEKLGWKDNPYLLGALAVSFLLQLMVLYTPLSGVFKTVALGLFEWSVLLIVAAVEFFVAIWLTKIIVRRVR